jgi:hypothetical protein
MRRLRAANLVVGLLAVGSLGTLTRAHVRSAQAQAEAPVRDFYGEADEEVRAVAAAPAGMVCGALSVKSGLSVQTTEPPGGFTGACLMNRSYGGGLPSVCYSPGKADYTGHAIVRCTLPAAEAVQPEWLISASDTTGALARTPIDNNFRVLETCAPHLTMPSPDCLWGPDKLNGNCPCNTVPVSHSCCTQFGTKMTTNDQGKTAVGTAYFSPQQP